MFFLGGGGSEKFYRAGRGSARAKQRVIGIFTRLLIELKLISQWYFFDKHVLEYQNDQIIKYRVIQQDCHKYFFSDGPNIFKKCHNPMIFRKLIKGGFGILMFQKCQVWGILPFEAFPI